MADISIVRGDTLKLWIDSIKMSDGSDQITCMLLYHLTACLLL